MKRSSRLVSAVAVALLVYAAVVVARGVFAPTELFPIFSWELFSRVPPAVEEDFSVRLTEIGGRPLRPTVYFEAAGAYLSTSHSPDAQALTQAFGRYAAAGDAARLANARATFESRYLHQLHRAQYEIVRRRFDVLGRVDCRCFTRQTVVARFALR